MQICIIIGANLASWLKKNDAGTAPTKSAIWDEFREQPAPKHKKHHI